jgi:hypothetical protein
MSTDPPLMTAIPIPDNRVHTRGFQDSFVAYGRLFMVYLRIAPRLKEIGTPARA